MAGSLDFSGCTDADFENLGLLGIGGFGEVRKLCHKATGAILACKMINKDHCTQAGVDALRKELELVRQYAALPHVIRYYCTIMYEGRLTLLMEFCDCGSLRDLMDYRNEVLTEDQIAFVLRDVLETLAVFHETYRCVHRDIKAGNILLTAKCEVKVTDFGVTRQFEEGAISAACRTMSVQGSPYWLAPECIRGDGASFPSDVWGVGATAVELAEGGPPYCEYRMEAAMDMIRRDGWSGFRNQGYFSHDFAQFVADCMIVPPKDRPTARALLRHPFILRTQTLDRLTVFADLPETQVDFAALAAEDATGEFADEELVPKVSKAAGKTLARPPRTVIRNATRRFATEVKPGRERPEAVESDWGVPKAGPIVGEFPAHPAAELPQPAPAPPQAAPADVGPARRGRPMVAIAVGLVVVLVLMAALGWKGGLAIGVIVGLAVALGKDWGGGKAKAA